MITPRTPDRISSWWVIFHPKSETPWVNRVVPGRFKHVTVVGYSPVADMIVFFDTAFGRAAIAVLPRSESALAELDRWAGGCSILKMATVDRPLVKRPPLAPLWCVPMVRALVGVPGGALRPDKFWRDCLRHGAEILQDVVLR